MGGLRVGLSLRVSRSRERTRYNFRFDVGKRASG